MDFTENSIKIEDWNPNVQISNSNSESEIVEESNNISAETISKITVKQEIPEIILNESVNQLQSKPCQNYISPKLERDPLRIEHSVKCKYCHGDFLGVSDLYKHIKMFHYNKIRHEDLDTSDDDTSDDNCDNTNDKTIDLNNGDQLLIGNMVKCRYCHKYFEGDGKLNNHMKSFHYQNMSYQKTNFQSTSYQFQSENDHKKIKLSTKEFEKIYEEANPCNIETVLKCAICGQCFESSKNMIIHSKSHKTQIQSVVKKSTPTGYIKFKKSIKKRKVDPLCIGISLVEQTHPEQTHVEQNHPEQTHVEQIHAKLTHLEQTHVEQIHPEQTHAKLTHSEETHLEQIHPEDTHVEQTHAKLTHPEQTADKSQNNTKKSKSTYPCAFPNCSFRGSTGLHKFPSDDYNRMLWMEACQLKNIKRSSLICDKHFNIKDFARGGNSRLKPNAIPIPNIYNSCDQKFDGSTPNSKCNFCVMKVSHSYKDHIETMAMK